MKKKIITRSSFTRKALYEIKMGHEGVLGENEIFVLKVFIKKWEQVILL
jgi:hypothetical protein